MADPAVMGALASFMFMGLFGLLFFILWIGIILVCLVGMVAWVLLLIDLVQRKFPKEDDKLLWLLIILFGGIIGAGIYYLIIVAPSKKKKVSQVKKK